ncbi:MAG: hypothetical protein GX359_08965 [Clostridiales bacterium]|nr:hypothetical protein [Clostridiales bacterium]
MIGILYLCLCFTTGWAICTYVFPELMDITRTSYNKQKINFSPYLLLLPAWYLVGTLLLTWATYMMAYAFAGEPEPLAYANIIVMPVAGVCSSCLLYFNVFTKYRNPAYTITKDKVMATNASNPIKRKNVSNKVTAAHITNTRNSVNPKKVTEGIFFNSNKTVQKIELILVFAISVLAFLLMWSTFFVNDSKLYVGLSVFSDFSPHIGMIRSFSNGNNFPTAYSHYAGMDIKYHFMFQFLVGNLEYLGLRLDYAFNLPSMLSFISSFLLLYLLALKITGKIGVGVLSCLFFAFRSSKALFTYLANLPAEKGILQALVENTVFIGDTPNEDWGLWNLNVYCNQRHLAFGLAIMFLIILLFLPRAYEMHYALQHIKIGKLYRMRKVDWKLLLRELFFTKESWSVGNYRLAIVSGIILGSLSFFHGAAVIGCLLVLFVIAIVSKHRLEFVILAAITIGLSLMQTNFFIEGSAVSPQFLFGFIAKNKTLFGVASYLERLLGILPLVLLVSFLIQKSIGKHLLIAFSLPLIFAFTVSLTVDVTVNHKYIMMSCILLGIFAADLVISLLQRREILIRFASILLILILTSTGIYDFITVLKKNTPDTAIVLDLKHPLTQWINENSDSQDIFLTSNYAINQVVLGGAMLYQGWQYFAWSAGYDTLYRDTQVKRMYEASSPGELDTLVKENNIRFIIVDQHNRNSEEYQVNEANIQVSYACVYREGEGEWETAIYDTQIPLFVTY